MRTSQSRGDSLRLWLPGPSSGSLGWHCHCQHYFGRPHLGSFPLVMNCIDFLQTRYGVISYTQCIFKLESPPPPLELAPHSILHMSSIPNFCKMTVSVVRVKPPHQQGVFCGPSPKSLNAELLGCWVPTARQGSQFRRSKPKKKHSLSLILCHTSQSVRPLKVPQDRAGLTWRGETTFSTRLALSGTKFESLYEVRLAGCATLDVVRKG